MTILFIQAGPPPVAEPGANAAWFVFALIPVILILAGMVMGFQALRDIRLADGALGGAAMATFAAGLLPAMFIVGASGAALTLLGKELMPPGRPRSDIWLTVGCGIGVWLSFLMMRGMHREATGWTPPDTRIHGRSLLATAAIVLTIAGAAVMLLALVLPVKRLPFGLDSREGVMLLDLPILIAGLICGVLSWREKAGKTCAWICGALFAVFWLLFAAYAA